jgi:hypothetical protein
MIIAIRTQKRLKSIAICFLIYCVVVGLTAAISPFKGMGYVDSFFKWMDTIPLFLLVWAVLELGGERFLGLEIWKQMSSAARVLLLVGLIVLLVVIWIVGTNWFEQ